MSKEICSAFIALICFLPGACVSAQTSSQPEQAPHPAASLTLEQLTAAAKRYFRDTAELPLIQKTAFAVSDSSGRARPVKNMTVDYIFNGYSRRSENATGHVHGKESIWAKMRGSKTFKATINSGLWTMIAGGQLVQDTSEFGLEVDENKENGLMTARLTRLKPCSAFAMMDNAEFYLPDSFCGVSEFQLQSDLIFRKFAFEVLELPAPVKLAPFGQCSLRRYHAEVEFQSVTLPGNQAPFLIPRQVTATLETDKGSIVITSIYTPRPAPLTKQ